MIVTTKELFEHAYGKYAVGAYNINNLEQTVGLFRGNLGKKDATKSRPIRRPARPFIIQLSRGARSYTDKRFLEAMIRTCRRSLSRGDLRRAPRPRHRRGLLRLHRERLLFVGDDRRLARDVRQEHRDHPPRRRAGPRARASRSRPSWACSAASKKTSQVRRRARLPDRSRPGRRVRRAQRLRLAGRGHRHLARGLQVHRQPRAALRPHRGDPEAAARLPAGDARLAAACPRNGSIASTRPAASCPSTSGVPEKALPAGRASWA